MANSLQVRKRARQSEKRRQHNASLKSAMNTRIKTVRTAIRKNDKDTAQKLYRETVSAMDKLVNKKIIKKNKASRHKSRLNQHIKNISNAVA